MASAPAATEADPFDSSNPVSLTLKAGTGFDAPWLVVRGRSVKDIRVQVEGAMTSGDFTVLAEADAMFKAQVALSNGVGAKPVASKSADTKPAAKSKSTKSAPADDEAQQSATEAAPAQPETTEGIAYKVLYADSKKFKELAGAVNHQWDRDAKVWRLKPGTPADVVAEVDAKFERA